MYQVVSKFKIPNQHSFIVLNAGICSDENKATLILLVVLAELDFSTAASTCVIKTQLQSCSPKANMYLWKTKI